MRRYAGLLIACFTLGLAPFFPLPHIVEKVRWGLGGARGMGVVDFFDLVFHASPWLLLAGVAAVDLLGRTFGAGPKAITPKMTRWVVCFAIAAAAFCVLWSRVLR